eukprot:g1315.t1
MLRRLIARLTLLGVKMNRRRVDLYNVFLYVSPIPTFGKLPSAQRLAAPADQFVLVQWVGTAPERTEGYEPAGREYWGPWYDRNWAWLPVALLQKEYNRADWTVTYDLLTHRLGVHGEFALYLPPAVVAEVRSQARVVVVAPPAALPATPAPGAGQKGGGRGAQKKGAKRGAAGAS